MIFPSFSVRTKVVAGISFVALLSMSLTFKPKAVEWTNEKAYDFGSVELGTTTGTTFTFRNTSSEPVLLQTVRTTCGCTAAKWPEQAVAPGATGDIKIEYVAEHSGPFRKKIRVFFDAMRKPEILYIYGEVH